MLFALMTGLQLFLKRSDKMNETRQTVFRQTKEEFERLKNDAYEHKMNISDYLRYLVAKERKEKIDV